MRLQNARLLTAENEAVSGPWGVQPQPWGVQGHFAAGWNSRFLRCAKRGRSTRSNSGSNTRARQQHGTSPGRSRQPSPPTAPPASRGPGAPQPTATPAASSRHLRGTTAARVTAADAPRLSGQHRR
jgi:hypothetical protein